MNARPFTALAIATLPYARGPVQEAQLYELLAGAVESFRQLGVVLTGGHTTEGSELALGFSVTGFGEEDRLFRKSNLRPGDQLVLTKPLGSGALLAAWMRGECRAAWFEALLAVMLQANAAAAAVFAAAGDDRLHRRDRLWVGGTLVGDARLQPGFRSFERSGCSAVCGLRRGGESGHCQYAPRGQRQDGLSHPGGGTVTRLAVRSADLRRLVGRSAAGANEGGVGKTWRVQAGYTNTAVIGTVVVSGTE